MENLKERENLPDQDTDKTQLALDTGKKQTVLNTIMNYWDPCTAPNFLTW
jgi:hypothetical protein